MGSYTFYDAGGHPRRLWHGIREYRSAVPGYQETPEQSSFCSTDDLNEARERLAEEARSVRQSIGMRVVLQAPSALTIRVEVPLTMSDSGVWLETAWQTIAYRIESFSVNAD